jgi:Predicted exporters of the RND superfamily
MTLLVIDIGIIRELAITASMGVAVIILTNLCLLLVLMSFLKLDQKYVEKFAGKENANSKFWEVIAACSRKKPAAIILIVTAILFVFGHFQAQNMKIGDLHAGAPALHETSRYNQDTFLITDKYEVTVDYISILVETTPEACSSRCVLLALAVFLW